MTFVIVGGGPTGVELAGMMVEIARKAMPRDFRNIDTRRTRVIGPTNGTLGSSEEAGGKRAAKGGRRATTGTPAAGQLSQTTAAA
jgi:hypothetical protein